MEKIDYNKDGMVDFNEFQVLMIKTMVSVDQSEEELVTVFKRFDKNKDDQIDANDLAAMFQELGHEMSLSEANDMIALFDKNEDGSLDF